MGHPLIDEFCRAHVLNPEFLRRCQRVFREEVQPLLDEREVLLQRVVTLETENSALRARATKKATVTA